MKPKVYLTPTSCCAMGLLKARSDATIDEIKGVLNEIKNQQIENWKGTPSDSGGQTIIQCITLDSEINLRTYLRIIGFHCVKHEFSRRNGYENENCLLVWILDINDYEK